MHGHCSPRSGGNQGEVLVCSEKTGTLQSVNSDRIVHQQSIVQNKWKATHFLLNLYLGFDLQVVVKL
jgi:hypothetical protein